MDLTALCKIIKNSKILRYKFMGVFAANQFPPLRNNTFQIINTQESNKPGEHWIMMARRSGNILYFGDSLGKDLVSYRPIFNQCQKHYNLCPAVFSGQHIKTKKCSWILKKLTQKKLQYSNMLCGAFCIYFAHLVFCRNHHSKIFTEFDVLTFLKTL